jgi:hypothetical protein
VNWKTLLQISRLPHFKKSFTTNGTRVAIADGYIACWEPSSEDGTWDKDGSPIDPASVIEKDNAQLIIKHHSPPLNEMIKVNSRYFRTAFAALEATKGSDAVYLLLEGKRICLAYEKDDVVKRAVVACMKGDIDGTGVKAEV